jgi:predicted nuclease of predicted toxin-antitoxin system
MRILFDNGIPRGLAALLLEHEVVEARREGWDELTNGELLRAAEDAGYKLLLTNDRRIPSQQNLAGRTIALLVLTTSQWPSVQAAAGQILEAVDAAVPGTYREIEIPLLRRR